MAGTAVPGGIRLSTRRHADEGARRRVRRRSGRGDVGPPSPDHAAAPSGSGIAAAFGGFAAGWTVASAAGLPGTAALVAGTLAAAVPGAMRRRTRDRELRREALRWPDFLAAVRSRLATGSAIPTACADAARHIGGRFLDLAAPSGVSFADTTASVRARWADPLTDRILTTLELAATVGGSHVGAVLGALTTSVNEDLRLRRAHDAALTEQRLTAGSPCSLRG